MDKILIIGDIHSQYQKKSYWIGIQKLFDYLIEEYSDYTFISTGDWYENSSPNNIVIDKMIKYLLKFKEAHILGGNHEYSKQKNSAILHLNNYETIFSYNEITKKTINGLKFLFIPFVYKEEDRIKYNNLQGEFDIIIPHLTPKKDSFGKEYWQPHNNLKANLGIFWGHIHLPKDYEEKGNKNFIIGVPQPVKNGEQNFEPRIFLIENKKIIEKKLPIFMTIKTINYGEEIIEKQHLYNIINASNIKSVYDTYKDCYIRHEGIELKQSKNEKIEILDISNLSLKEKFKQYCNEEKISSNIMNCGLKYLEKV